MKTVPTAVSVKGFIDAIPDDRRRRDCRAVMKIMRAATGASLAGFSPRKQDLTLYIISDFDGHASVVS